MNCRSIPGAERAKIRRVFARYACPGDSAGNSENYHPRLACARRGVMVSLTSGVPALSVIGEIPVCRLDCQSAGCGSDSVRRRHIVSSRHCLQPLLWRVAMRRFSVPGMPYFSVYRQACCCAGRSAFWMDPFGLRAVDFTEACCHSAENNFSFGNFAILDGVWEIRRQMP